jgi:hypothetical protein
LVIPFTNPRTARRRLAYACFVAVALVFLIAWGWEALH